MEHFQGRPVWHCSVSRNGALGSKKEISRAADLAAAVLADVGEGSPMAEMGSGVIHVRRYLTDGEADAVGGVVDVRGRPEHSARVEAVREWLPKGWLAQIGEAP
jgi:hypothetical protein